MSQLVIIAFIIACLVVFSLDFSIDQSRHRRRERAAHVDTCLQTARSYRVRAQRYANMDNPEMAKEMLREAQRADEEAALAIRDAAEPLWKVWA